MLFHKYGGENVSVTNCMSHFSMFFQTKATVKLANGNTVHVQGIVIILCLFSNWPIIYLAGQVYYFPGRRYNTISEGALNFRFGLKGYIITSWKLRGFWPSRSFLEITIPDSKNLDYLLIRIVKVKLHRYNNISPNCLCNFKTKYISDYSSAFFSCIYYQPKTNGKKRTHEKSSRKPP